MMISSSWLCGILPFTNQNIKNQIIDDILYDLLIVVYKQDH